MGKAIELDDLPIIQFDDLVADIPDGFELDDLEVQGLVPHLSTASVFCGCGAGCNQCGLPCSE